MLDGVNERMIVLKVILTILTIAFLISTVVAYINNGYDKKADRLVGLALILYFGSMFAFIWN